MVDVSIELPYRPAGQCWFLFSTKVIATLSSIAKYPKVAL